MIERWIDSISRAPAWQRPLLLLAGVALVVAFAFGVHACVNYAPPALSLAAVVLAAYGLLYKLME